MTLLAIWLGREVNLVQSRKAWLKDNAALIANPTPNPLKAPKLLLPPWRYLMGDEELSTIFAPPDWSEREQERATRLFSEAHITRLDLP